MLTFRNAIVASAEFSGMGRVAAFASIGLPAVAMLYFFIDRLNNHPRIPLAAKHR